MYNTVTASFVAKNVSDSGEITLPASGSAVIVCIPSGGRISYDGKKMLVDGVTVDYNIRNKIN